MQEDIIFLLILSILGTELSLYSVWAELSWTYTQYKQDEVKLILSMHELSWTYTQYKQDEVRLILSVRGTVFGLYLV